MTTTTIYHKFSYPFSEVSLAFWNKFPNKYSEHVKTVDIIDRTLTDGILSTTRIFNIEANHSYIPDTALYSLEKTTIDPKNKTLSGTNTNLSLRNIFNTVETIKYEELTPTTTAYTQTITISVKIPLIGNRVERFLMDKAKEKSLQGIDVIDDMLSKRKHEK